MGQGFLQPLDDYIAASGFDTSTFFPGYLAPFKGSDGKIYGLPKDGNTIGMAYNTADVTTPPASMADLTTAAQVREHECRHDERGDAERNVDEEHPPP
jgi:maltose-binding protein MalE